MRILCIVLLSVSLVGCAGLTDRAPITNESGQVIGHEPSILDGMLSAGGAKATEVDLGGDILEGDWMGALLGGASVLLAGGGAGVVAHRRKKKREAAGA